MSAAAFSLAGLCLLGAATAAVLVAIGLVRTSGSLAASLGAWILSLLPREAYVQQSRRLAQADLDERFTAEAWVGLLAWPWLLAGAVSLLALAADRSVIASVAVGCAVASAACAESLLRRRIRDRERRFLKDLPAYLDVLTVCVEAGATLAVALRMAVDKAAASPARKVFARMLHEVRMGRSRTEALNNVARLYELEALTSLVAALVQSEGHGMSLGAVLRAQSQQRAIERQLRAEKAAMKAPVKMLGPLVLCIFPCTFVVIAVPVLVRMFLDGG